MAGLVVFVVVAPAVLGGTSVFDTLVLSGILGVAVVGLSMLAGYAGQISMGQGALLGAGAYGSAIATTRWDWPPLAGMLFGALLVLVAALAAAVVLRLSGLYLAVATLALGYILEDLFYNLKSWTKGSDGIAGLARFSLFGWEVRSDAQFFRLAWAVVLLALVVHINLARSRVGRGLLAIHADEAAARSLGIPAFRYKVVVWMIAAFLAGVSGSLYAHYFRFTQPDLFTLGLSVTILAAVVVGGSGSLFGPVFGIVALRLLPEISKHFEWASNGLLTGVVLVTVMVLAPGGLAEIWHRALRGVQRRLLRARGTAEVETC
jgi:branched-chain amino acid transport system permease protein